MPDPIFDRPQFQVNPELRSTTSPPQVSPAIDAELQARLQAHVESRLQTEEQEQALRNRGIARAERHEALEATIIRKLPGLIVDQKAQEQRLLEAFEHALTAEGVAQVSAELTRLRTHILHLEACHEVGVAPHPPTP